MTSDLDFKVTTFFEVEYLKNGMCVSTGDIAACHIDQSDITGDHGSWYTHLGCGFLHPGNDDFCDVSVVTIAY